MLIGLMLEMYKKNGLGQIGNALLVLAVESFPIASTHRNLTSLSDKFSLIFLNFKLPFTLIYNCFGFN
jgi:hypothetical protein